MLNNTLFDEKDFRVFDNADSRIILKRYFNHIIVKTIELPLFCFTYLLFMICL